MRGELGALSGRGVPLRVGLVAATLVLVACGLLASGIAVTTITAAQPGEPGGPDAARRVARLGAGARRVPSMPAEGPNPARPPSNFYVRGVDPDGRIWMAVNDRDAEPVLPDDNDVGPEPVTVHSVNHSNVTWRAMTVRGPAAAPSPRWPSICPTCSRPSARWSGPRLGIGAAVLLVLGVAGYAVVHRSLRPLTEVEETAAAIAAGQLDRRVPQRDPRTEVGRLSLALNGMLAQIQRAIAASESSAEQARSSEERMRRSSPTPATSCAPR